MRPLWPHQARLLADARAAAARLAADGNRSPGVLIQLPTGGGKTRIGLEAAIAHLASRPTNSVVWFAHREELVDQPLARLHEEGVRDVAALRPGSALSPTARIHVCSIQTWLARLDSGDVPSASLVVFDEARHYVAAQWGRAADRYRDTIRIGLDATPVRLDGAPLGDLFDVLVQGPQVSELVASGHLVPSVIIGPDTYVEELADDPIEAYLRHTPGQRAIFFCSSVAHARQEAAAAVARGIPAECVEGATAKAHRRGALGRLAAGTTQIVTNVFCLTEGTDVPAVEVVAVARGCAAEGAWVQMLGRGARISSATGKTRLTVLDLRGHMWRHGALDTDRTYRLDGAAIRRDVEPLQAVSQCRQCLGWSRPSSRCPQCGAMTPPPKPPRVTKREMREQRLARVRRSGEQWELWCALVQEGRTKGWKPQAPAMRYRALTGHFPRFTADMVPA